MKKIKSNHFQVKRVIEGKNVSVIFVPNVKTVYAPTIAESYVNDEMQVMHILTNGNEISENNYLKYWGKPKTAVQWDAKVVKHNPNPFANK